MHGKSYQNIYFYNIAHKNNPPFFLEIIFLFLFLALLENTV